MARITSLAGARSHFVGEQRVRLLRIYLGATTFLYTYGVVFTLFPVRTDLAYGNPIGGIIAIVLGVLGLVQLAVRPNRAMFATAVAVIATPVVMAFHVTLTAEYVCLIAPMFLAMYIRAFHPSRQAWVLIGFLILACVVAVVVAPAPHVGVITVLIIVVAIAGAAESFGLLMRAMFTAACTDPLTGLLNRAGWEIATTDLLAAVRASAAITVVALDIDDLKGLNDTQGHPAGDRLIVEYARHWARMVPRRAVLARLGGDEFAVCIAGRDTEDAETFLGDVRSTTPRVSVGAATRTSGTIDIADLYARADAELYRGRDKARGDEARRDDSHGG